MQRRKSLHDQAERAMKAKDILSKAGKLPQEREEQGIPLNKGQAFRYRKLKFF